MADVQDVQAVEETTMKEDAPVNGVEDDADNEGGSSEQTKKKKKRKKKKKTGVAFRVSRRVLGYGSKIVSVTAINPQVYAYHFALLVSKYRQILLNRYIWSK